MADAWHIQQIVSRARALGADQAAPLPARAVVVDERVRLKCRVPLCAHYGVNLMCPPHTPSPAETRAALARYTDTLVVQREIPLSQAAVDQAVADIGCVEKGAASLPVAYRDRLHESQNEFAAIMSSLEAEAYSLGYRFAAAYAGGDCVLCDGCVGVNGEPCRHPFEARPSMEAVGIDVLATSEAAGLALEMPAAEHPRWTGLLLID